MMSAVGDTDKLKTISQLRREQPRNWLVIQVCDWAESAIIGKKKPKTRAQIQKAYRDRKRKEREAAGNGTGVSK